MYWILKDSVMIDRTYWPSSFQMKKSTICLNVKKYILLFLFFYWFHISFLCYLAHFSHTAQHLFCWRGGFILYTDLGHGLYAGLGGLDSSRIHVVFQCADWLLLHVTPLWIIHAVCVLDADNKLMTVTRRMYTIEYEGKAVFISSGLISVNKNGVFYGKNNKSKDMAYNPTAVVRKQIWV